MAIIIIFHVIVPPILTIKPSDQTVIEDKELTFHCSASGNPTPKITWTKDGEIVSHGDTLSFKANRINSGKYLCSAENGLEITVNACAYLDVQCEFGNTVLIYSGTTTLRHFY